MTKNDEIANMIVEDLGYHISDMYTLAYQCAMSALEYKDKEIAKIKQALQSVLDEFSKMNIG